MTVNTCSNLGTGRQIFSSIVVTDAQFRTLTPGTGINAVQATNDVTVSVNQASALAWANLEKFLGLTSEPTIDPIASMPSIDTAYSIKATRTAPTGNSGKVQTAVFTDVKVASGVNSFEWANTILLENNSTSADAGQNVGQYIKAYKHSTGQTWGAVFECQDTNGNSNSTLIGLELDLCYNGSTTGFRRGIAMWYGDAYPNTRNPTGITTKWDVGIDIYPFALGRNQMDMGISLGGTFNTAVINMMTLQNTPIAMAMAGGAALKFSSGTAASATPTWYFGAFTPTWFGAIRVVVDSTTVYIPVSSNHP
jgi:hypothetical protein